MRDPKLGLATRTESKSPWDVLGEVPSASVIVFVLGPNGAGKSLQCKRLARKWVQEAGSQESPPSNHAVAPLFQPAGTPLHSLRMGYTHLSSGELLRQEVASGSKLGEWAQVAEMSIRIVSSGIVDSAQCQKRWLGPLLHRG